MYTRARARVCVLGRRDRTRQSVVLCLTNEGDTPGSSLFEYTHTGYQYIILYFLEEKTGHDEKIQGRPVSIVHLLPAVFFGIYIRANSSFIEKYFFFLQTCTLYSTTFLPFILHTTLVSSPPATFL